MTHARVLVTLHVCCHPLLQATLCDALPAREWPLSARQLLQGMVNLLTALLHNATEGPCAQRLLSLLFEVRLTSVVTDQRGD